MLVQEHTYLPGDVDETLAEALEGELVGPEGTMRLYVRVDDGAVYQLPESLSHVLRQVAGAMREGLAVTVKPQSQQLSTSQAAELLGVTRPTVVKLLEAGVIPFTRVGSHRRLALLDVLHYRDSRREARYEFLTSTRDEDEQPRSAVLADLKRIRHELGESRRRGRAND